MILDPNPIRLGTHALVPVGKKQKTQVRDVFTVTHPMRLVQAHLWIGVMGGGSLDTTMWVLLDPPDWKGDPHAHTIATFFWDHYCDPTGPHGVLVPFGKGEDHYVANPGDMVTLLCEHQAFGAPGGGSEVGVTHFARLEWARPYTPTA